VRSPIYSTGVGLLLYGRDNTTSTRGRRPGGKTAIDRMKSWFQGNF
jgi:cell division protein FtsA